MYFQTGMHKRQKTQKWGKTGTRDVYRMNEPFDGLPSANAFTVLETGFRACQDAIWDFTPVKQQVQICGGLTKQKSNDCQ
eukprot:m.157076 g.157076  ORF g.157076 m.157076 type:complete len:80 (-) comp16305_c0_seq4:24-263(-)